MFTPMDFDPHRANLPSLQLSIQLTSRYSEENGIIRDHQLGGNLFDIAQKETTMLNDASEMNNISPKPQPGETLAKDQRIVQISPKLSGSRGWA
jgi:hypothetical protein